MEQKKWYTWTDARPSFYEGIRRRPPGNEEHAQAPWGLNCSRGKMMELEFYLTDAKAAKGGRLSVSRETKSEIVGNRDLSGKEIREMVIWDYRRLFQRQMIQNREPVLAGAVHCKKGRFDTVKQRFDMEIYDVQGNCLHVAVTYSKEERLTIRVLERLSGRLDRQEDSPLVFFGIPYLEEGKICLYPVEYFDGAGLCPSVNGSESGQENRIDCRRAVCRSYPCRGTMSAGDQSDAVRSFPKRTPLGAAGNIIQMYSMEREAAGLGPPSGRRRTVAFKRTAGKSETPDKIRSGAGDRDLGPANGIHYNGTAENADGSGDGRNAGKQFGRGRNV